MVGTVWILLRLVALFLLVSYILVIDKHVLGLLLSMDVTEADIVNAQLKVLTMLHYAQIAIQDGKIVRKCSLKLLSVAYHDAIPQYSSLA